MRRAAGTGQVEQLPSGKHRVRLVVDGLRRTLGIYDTREEADAVLAEARRLVASGDARPTSGTTVRGWLEEWRDSRQRENRWPNSYDFALAHLVAASWARTPLVHLRSDEIRDWLHEFARTPLARTGTAPTHGSAQLVWTVLRVALVEAVESKRIAAAPITGVRLPERTSRELMDQLEGAILEKGNEQLVRLYDMALEDDALSPSAIARSMDIEVREADTLIRKLRDVVNEVRVLLGLAKMTTARGGGR